MCTTFFLIVLFLDLWVYQQLVYIRIMPSTFLFKTDITIVPPPSLPSFYLIILNKFCCHLFSLMLRLQRRCYDDRAPARTIWIRWWKSSKKIQNLPRQHASGNYIFPLNYCWSMLCKKSINFPVQWIWLILYESDSGSSYSQFHKTFTEIQFTNALDLGKVLQNGRYYCID